MAEIILALIGETHIKAGTTKKFYGFMEPCRSDRRTATIKYELDQNCIPCPLRNDCLPEAKIGLGKSVIFTARMSSDRQCLIPKTEKGSLRIGIILKQS